MSVSENKNIFNKIKDVGLFFGSLPKQKTD